MEDSATENASNSLSRFLHKPSADWVAKRFPYFLAALACWILAIILACTAQPYHASDEASTSPPFFQNLTTANETNAFARTSRGNGSFAAVALAPDGKHALTGDGNGVFYSDDAGQHWKRSKSIPKPSSDNTLSYPDILSFAWNEDSLSAYSVSDKGAISESVDGGISWSHIAQLTDLNASELNLISVGNQHTHGITIIVANGSQYYASNDTGRTWSHSTFVPNDRSTQDANAPFFDIAFSPNKSFAIANGFESDERHGSVRHFILQSRGNALSWQMRFTEAGPLSYSTSTGSIAFSQDSKSIIIPSSGGHYEESNDSGLSWRTFTIPSLDRQNVNEGNDLIGAFFLDNTSALLFDSRNNIYETTGLEAPTLRDHWRGQDIPTFFSTHTINHGVILAVNPMTGIVRSNDYGRNWDTVFDERPFDQLGYNRSMGLFLISRDGSLFSGGRDGLIWQDDPLSPSNAFANLLSNSGSSGIPITYLFSSQQPLAFTYDNDQTEHILGIREHDTHWKELARLPFLRVSSIAESADSHVLLALAESDTNSKYRKILISRDGGTTWSEQASFLDSGMAYSNLVISENGSLAVYAHVADGLDRISVSISHDLGAHWVSKNLKLRASLDSEPRNGYIITLSHDGQGIFIIGANASFLRSNNQGKSWVSGRIPTNYEINDVALAPDGSTAIAVGNNGTIYRCDQPYVCNWTAMVFPYSANLTGVSFGKETNSLVAISQYNIYVSSDGGKTWDMVVHHRELPLISWIFIFIGILLTTPLFVPVVTTPKTNSAKSFAELLSDDNPVEEQRNDASGRAYALALRIADFLYNIRTSPPLTIAVTGPWGSGKSSVLKLLCGELTDRGVDPVWFNAWHHQKEESIYAALLEQIRKQAIPPLISLQPRGSKCLRIDGIRIYLRLIAQRLQKNGLAVAFSMLLAAFLVSFLTVTIHAIVDQIHAPINNGEMSQDAGKIKLLGELALSSIPGGGIFLIVLKAINFTRFRIKSRELDPAKLLIGMTGVARWTEIGGQLAYRTKFADALKEVTEALGSKRLVIIIDDLDRCRPDNITEVLEAMNFLASAAKCCMVLAIDRKQIISGIGVAYSTIAIEHALPETEPRQARMEYANSFLRKLIQIEVTAPRFTGQSASALINIISDLSEKTKASRDYAWKVITLTIVITLCASLAVFLGYNSAMRLTSQISISEVSGTARTESSVPTNNIYGSGNSVDRKSSQSPQHDYGLWRGYGEFHSGRSDAPASTSFVVFLISLAAIIGLAGLAIELTKTIPPIIDDEKSFKDALEIWTPAAYDVDPSPREFKRFLNQLRFLASYAKDDDALPAQTLVGLAVIGRLQPSLLHSFAQGETDLIPRLLEYAKAEEQAKSLTPFANTPSPYMQIEAAIRSQKQNFQPTPEETRHFLNLWRTIDIESSAASQPDDT